MAEPLLIPSPGARVRIVEVGEFSAHAGIASTRFAVGKVLSAKESPHKGWLAIELVLESTGSYLYCAQCRVEELAKAVA
ncbi:MAG TPA: hypothetical protein VG734_25525 [Lacunisphaera sp.]|nr:hypothetical protein [Lacunisphaera sp.]